MSLAAALALVLVGPLARTVGAEDGLLACRRAAGRHGARLLRTAVATLQHCEERRLLTPSLSCPRAADETALARARERTHAAIAAACADTLPEEFAGPCPAPCAGVVADATALAECIACIAEASAGSFVDAAFPRPPGGVCGDGFAAAGEACDPPDDGACPGRCVGPGVANACQCGGVQRCTDVGQPPNACAADGDCPPAYACNGGQCEGGACVVKAECPADGECVHVGSAASGTCVCRGCAPWSCPLGCTIDSVMSGCLCNEQDDCPPENDVCFLGVCS